MSNHSKAFLGKDYSKIQSTNVVVCGVGALGSNLVLHMAQEGYARLTVIDFDRVDNNNPWTQVYGLPDVGGLKVQVLKGALVRKFKVPITDVSKKLDAGNAEKLLKGADLVVDTFDNWESRILVRDTCRKLNIACVHGGMNEQGYSHVKWNDGYEAPTVEAPQEDLCDYPLAGPLIHMTVALLHTAITHYVITGQKVNRSFTLRDLKLWDF